MFNFAEAAAEGASRRAPRIEVADAHALVGAVAALLADAPRRAAMRAAALAFHAAHRGAADRLWAWLAPRIDAAIDARRAREGGRQPLSWRLRSSRSCSVSAPTDALRRSTPIRYLK